ncbi:hypothetical protein [Longivirga aurantiaca]|uniref:Uncharacterized protein n=1 Tax=Longivirga aurantiaca TaxID=1837743 RepID=A0ABW1T0N3_9ACTN
MGQDSRAQVGGPAALLEVRINARVQPVHRGDRYEDPLAFLLERDFPGSAVTGGGTLVSGDGEPLSCAIDADVVGDRTAIADAVVELLEAQGAPRGSSLAIDHDDARFFGSTDGLALYLDGTGLPPEVYAAHDINELLDRIHIALGETGALQSYWEGPADTALYMYGPSVAAMGEALADLLATHPLTVGHRLLALS